MISGGRGGFSRLSCPPLPWSSGDAPALPIPPDLGRSESDRIAVYDLSGGGTGDRKVPVPSPCSYKAVCSQGSAIGRLAHVVYVNVVKSGDISELRLSSKSEAKKKPQKKQSRVDSSRLASAGASSITEPEKHVSKCNLAA